MSFILQENLNFNQAKLVVEAIENEGKAKSWYMKGTFIQGGVRNLNQRTYPVHEIEKAVNHVNEIIRGGEDVLGECDHPDELTVNLDRVSHVIEAMWMDGSTGVGKLKILPTPKGNIIATLLDCGIKLGVSSRGSGNVDDRGQVSDFEIVTIDVVCKPSAQNAYPKAVYEALNTRRGLIIDDLSRAVMHDPKAQKHLHTEVLSAIDRLNLR